jgi:hypothetical protein
MEGGGEEEGTLEGYPGRAGDWGGRATHARLRIRGGAHTRAAWWWRSSCVRLRIHGRAHARDRVAKLRLSSCHARVAVTEHVEPKREE